MTPIAEAFIIAHIESVLQLELLLLLAADPGRALTVDDLTATLRVDRGWLDAELRRMGHQDWLTADPLPPPDPPPPPGVAAVAYRYAPRTAEQSGAIAAVAAAYADRRVAVIGLIFNKPTDKIRSFADAFRIRRNPADG